PSCVGLDRGGSLGILVEREHPRARDRVASTPDAHANLQAALLELERLERLELGLRLDRLDLVRGPEHQAADQHQPAEHRRIIPADHGSIVSCSRRTRAREDSSCPLASAAPLPITRICSAGTPTPTRKSRTEAARRSFELRLYCRSPRSSS